MAADAHRIRLRPAWQRCGGAPFDAARSQRVTVPDPPPIDPRPIDPRPADPRPADPRPAESVVVYRRSFNRPTGLEPHSRVWLVFRSVVGSGPLRLNGQLIGQLHASSPAEAPAALRFELTGKLQNANLIEVTLAAPSPALPALDGEVYLELV